MQYEYSERRPTALAVCLARKLALKTSSTQVVTENAVSHKTINSEKNRMLANPLFTVYTSQGCHDRRRHHPHL
jgi:hypothetical protein